MATTVTARPATGADRVAGRLERRPGLPGTRAVVGALLMALAAVGTFVAYTDATADHGRSVVVAAHAIATGSTIDVGDLELVTLNLTGAQARASFDEIDGIVGRVALGPLGSGEVVQRGGVTERAAADPANEISFAVDKANAVDGHLRSGDLVDLFATYGDVTTSIARRVPVRSTGESGGSITSAREITLTVAISDDQQMVELVHAIQSGKVTVVRSTFAEGDNGDLTYRQPSAKTTATTQGP